MLSEYTIEELMIEYLEDAIEGNPMEAYPRAALENGITFQRTGDDIIDQWERDLAEGKQPDIAAAFDKEQKAVFERWKNRRKRGAPTEPKPQDQTASDDLEFADTYGEEK